MLFRIGLILAIFAIGAPALRSDEKAADVIPEKEDPGLQRFLEAAKQNSPNPFTDEEFVKRIEEHIQRLGDADSKIRDAAEQGLREIGNSARAALERAKSDGDADVSTRAAKVLDELPGLTHVVTDVFDSPIPRAKVVLKLTSRTGEQPPIPQTVTIFADDHGRIPVPQPPATGYQMTAQIEHPDFGNSQYEVGRPGPLQHVLRFPLVKRDSDLYQRAVKGVVVSHEGKPVVGAVVQCGHVRTPGEGLINGIYPRGDAVTDSKGRFTYYLANENRDRERGELIPVNSRYDLSISVPGDESYFPVTGMYNNSEPVQITLPRAERFHRFFFEAAGGGVVEDMQQLRYMRVQYETKQDNERRLVPLDWEVVVKGRKLIPGTYRATGFLNDKSIEFRPLVIKEDSSEEQFFQLPPAVVYHGRIVHGVTDVAIPDAFLIGWSSTSRDNLALLSADDWKLLRTAPSVPESDHPALLKLRQHYGVQELVRTDAEGRFEITRRPEQEFYGLMAFAEDFVPFKKAMHDIQPNKRNVVDVGEFPLFPAGKVLVRPVYDGDRLSVSPKWLPTKEDQPEWIDRFHAAGDRSGKEFEYVHWLKLNELQPVFVPADVRLRLRFETPYDDQWSPHTIAKPIQLKPAATLEIGDIRFAAALSAVVHVFDKEGHSVEGIPVRRMHNADRAWCVAHNTDKDGRAFFYINPNSQGQFWVSDIRGPEEVAMAKNLFADFDVAEAAPDHEFQITVTDEQIRLLLGAKKIE